MSQNRQDPKQNLRESLSARSPEELADICAELIFSYVVKKQAPTVDQLGMMPVPENIRGMNFSQLVLWMKTNLSFPELDRFEVQDDRVSVRIGEQLYPLDAARFQGTPEAPATDHSPADPPRPAPAAAPAPAGSSGPSLAAAIPNPKPNPDPAKASTDETMSERFSMLEID